MVKTLAVYYPSGRVRKEALFGTKLTPADVLDYTLVETVMVEGRTKLEIFDHIFLQFNDEMTPERRARINELCEFGECAYASMSVGCLVRDGEDVWVLAPIGYKLLKF